MDPTLIAITFDPCAPINRLLSASTHLKWRLFAPAFFLVSLCKGYILPWNLVKHTFSHARSLTLSLVRHAIKSACLLWIHECLAGLMFLVALLRIPLLCFPTCVNNSLDPGVLLTSKGSDHRSDAYIAAVMLWVLCICAVYASKMQLVNVSLLH